MVANKLNARLKTSEEGVNLIASFEGFRNRAYDDGKGVWTIGFGHTHGVHQGQVITRQTGLRLLREDLIEAENIVKQHVTVALSQRQFDALVSAVFNLGSTIVTPYVNGVANSHFAICLNRRQFARAANRLLDWSDPGLATHAGLLRRRKAERKLFLAGCPRRYRIAARTGVR